MIMIWVLCPTDEEVLLRVDEGRNIPHETTKRKANWIGHILRRNSFLKQVIEGKIKGQIEVTRRQGRRRKKSDVWLTVHRNSVWIRKTN
jgi:hypothetical protein